MKESKIAVFENAVFGADIENGAVTGLSVLKALPAEKNSLSSSEVLELRDWLNSVTGAKTTVTFAPNPALNQFFPAVGAPVTSNGTVPLESRLTGAAALIMAPGSLAKVSDAESVKNRLPIDKFIAGDGMKLEDMSDKLVPIKVIVDK